MNRDRDRKRPLRRSRVLVGLGAGKMEALETRALMSATLLKDLNPVDTSPANITGVGGKVFFTVRNASGGQDLYETDGSVNGGCRS